MCDFGSSLGETLLIKDGEMMSCFFALHEMRLEQKRKKKDTMAYGGVFVNGITDRSAFEKIVISSDVTS